MQEIPTVRPTEEQFLDPIGFLSSNEMKRLGMKYGMVKMIPPQSFEPEFSIDEEKFSFRCRLQVLMELDIENRSRLLFWKQLNNLKRRKSDTRLLPSPQVTVGPGQPVPVYYYDIYKAVIGYFEPGGEGKSHSEGRGSNHNYNFRKRQKREESSYLKNGRYKLVDPRVVMEDKGCWQDVSSKFPEMDAALIKRVFKMHILPYYRFLYDEMVSKVSSASAPGSLSELLYNYDYPKSLLEMYDSAEESTKSGELSPSGTDHEIFSDELPETLRHDHHEDEESSEDEEDKCPICSKHISSTGSSSASTTVATCSSCDFKFHKRCVGKKAASPASSENEWVCNTCIIGNGYYGFKEPSSLYTLKSFKEHCARFDYQQFSGNKPDDIETLEKMFWNHVEKMVPNPITVKYGADIHNIKPGQTTGFPTMEYIPPSVSGKESEEYKQYLKISAHPWNLINLPRAKGSLLSIINRNISGMTIPWIYVGSTFSTFCWHLEDQYTLSANYQHAGSQKVWYSIPERSSAAFDQMMKNISPDLFERQPDLLHQLITLVSPYSERFVKAGIDCYKAVQNPGEYIITYPKCYHAGFNSGFNFNEAVNFTLDLWLPYGLQSIDDYKKTKRTAVVNIFDLMSNVLEAYLIKPESFDDSFVATCVFELKEWFNADFKNMMKVKGIVGEAIFSTGCNDTFRKSSLDHINEKGFIRRTLQSTDSVKSNNQEEDENDDDDDNDEDEDDLDVFCSQSKTICPIAFVVRYIPKRFRSKRKNLASTTPNEWNQLAAEGNVVIYCLEEYLKYVDEKDAEDDVDGHSDDSNSSSDDLFRNDILVYMRELDDVRELIAHAEKALDKRLR
ncbi:unnamed protein product [Kluyveromyces dobzhanskii CBS 2104]|uniref:WGS project CCBQ000000000 data, contig 00102 n=1 Tax=Kluyveromyces dobzhanskii CBS 2104 TaxID=1427455 RepID=A0A0A8L6G0_9SACH|nr:unnamed protein product [Kluyveromyces dobzhanskii CBS 2104]